MIAKKVPNPKASASKSARASGLVNYITEPERENGLEKCIHHEADNFICDDLASQTAEMIALATDNVRSKDPIDHWILSWRADERPTVEQAREAVATTIKHFGLEGHQVIWGLHDDTKNMHVHIAVNRVHPETLKVIKINKGFDREASQQAIALIEHAQGWKPESGSRYQIIDSKPERREKVTDKQLEPSRKALDMEIQTGTKSVQRTGIEEAAPIISNAKTWAELHTAMQAAGMSYERKGSGAVIQVGDVTLKASDVDRKASIGALQKRLGPYQPPKEINPNDYHHHTTHAARSPTGAIVATQKPHALETGKDTGHSLRPLSQCGMAHSEESKSPSRPRVLHLDARADRRAVDGLRRDTGGGIQPVKQNQPGWAEYQIIKAERRDAKDTDLLAQRKQQEAEKDRLYEKHRAERADVLKGNWEGKGDLKNAMSSVIATQQAAEKRVLQEQHKAERDALHARYVPLPQYKAWQAQPRLLAPVAAMAHSRKQPERLSTVLLTLRHSQDKRGITYQDRGQDLFIDQGRSLAIVKHEQQSLVQIAAALAVAQQKYGVELTVTGPDEFKHQAVAAAVAHDLKVKFSDPAMEAQRVKGKDDKRQAERDAQERQRAEQVQTLAAQAKEQAEVQAQSIVDAPAMAVEVVQLHATPPRQPGHAGDPVIDANPQVPVPELIDADVTAAEEQAKVETTRSKVPKPGVER